jgi:hypothetical protein
MPSAHAASIMFCAARPESIDEPLPPITIATRNGAPRTLAGS